MRKIASLLVSAFLLSSFFTLAGCFEDPIQKAFLEQEMISNPDGFGLCDPSPFKIVEWKCEDVDGSNGREKKITTIVKNNISKQRLEVEAYETNYEGYIFTVRRAYPLEIYTGITKDEDLAFYGPDIDNQQFKIIDYDYNDDYIEGTTRVRFTNLPWYIDGNDIGKYRRTDSGTYSVSYSLDVAFNTTNRDEEITSLPTWKRINKDRYTDEAVVKYDIEGTYICDSEVIDEITISNVIETEHNEYTGYRYNVEYELPTLTTLQEFSLGDPALHDAVDIDKHATVENAMFGLSDNQIKDDSVAEIMNPVKENYKEIPFRLLVTANEVEIIDFEKVAKSEDLYGVIDKDGPVYLEDLFTNNIKIDRLEEYLTEKLIEGMVDDLLNEYSAVIPASGLFSLNDSESPIDRIKVKDPLIKTEIYACPEKDTIKVNSYLCFECSVGLERSDIENLYAETNSLYGYVSSHAYERFGDIRVPIIKDLIMIRE